MGSASAASILLLLLAFCFTFHHGVVEGRGLASSRKTQVRLNGSTQTPPNDTNSYDLPGPSEDVNHNALCYSRRSAYYGARAKMSVHMLPDVTTGHRSSASIQLINDEIYGFNAIQAGWMVCPDIFGDSQTRLYTHWTADIQHKTGCFNTECNGFVVQSGSLMAPGDILEVSTYGGQQTYVALSITKDSATRNWWLTYEDEIQLVKVGYWPSSLFIDGLAFRATQVRYGGFVSSPSGTKSSPMGSGHFPIEGEHKAASFKNLELLDEFKSPYDYSDLAIRVDCPEGYALNLIGDLGGVDGAYFYYGGPGGCTN